MTSRLLLALLLAAPAAAAADAARIAAAGDIACDPDDPRFAGGLGTATACRMRATSDLLVGAGLDAVLTLGDTQYEVGDLDAFRASFDLTWGRLRPLLRPAPGNHDYLTANAAGYRAYFGAAAAPAGGTWYSFDLEGWHLVALDSNCGQVDGCGPGSAQDVWLREDLARHAGRCLLAFWHHPRFSSGPHGNDTAYVPFWQRLHAAGADLVLNGHDHIYERFAPQDPAGHADPERGIRQFTVGTGGRNLTAIVEVRPQSEVRRADRFGVLRLTLRPDGYSWRFVDVDGRVIDAGAGFCHTAAQPAAAWLDEGRFRVEATWNDETGVPHAAHVVRRSASDIAALFWFFAPDNWELLVRVLDGCAVNDRRWAFVSTTTDRGWSVVVTDTRTGETRRYDSPVGRAAPPVLDTAAFPCP